MTVDACFPRARDPGRGEHRPARVVPFVFVSLINALSRGARIPRPRGENRHARGRFFANLGNPGEKSGVPRVDDAVDRRPTPLILRDDALDRRPTPLILRDDAVDRRPTPLILRDDALVRRPTPLILRDDAVDRRPTPLILRDDAVDRRPTPL